MECCGTEWPHGPIPVLSNKHQGRLPSLLQQCLKLEMRLKEKTNILELLNILLLKQGIEQIAFADTVVLAQRLQAEKKKRRYYALILE
jgi:asparagine synthetase B (glutamine-hydrolysing)